MRVRTRTGAGSIIVLLSFVAVGSVGSAGGTSIVSLPSPHPVFEDVAADGFILPEDIPDDAAPAG